MRLTGPAASVLIGLSPSSSYAAYCGEFDNCSRALPRRRGVATSLVVDLLAQIVKLPTRQNMKVGDVLALAADLQKLIDRTYAQTWHSFEDVKAYARLFGIKKKTVDGWKTPSEPAFVAYLASHPFARRRLAELIERHLSPKISKGKPLVSGVFVHQKPKVKFGRPASQIELGDILFVRHHFQSKAKSPEGRAFLLQAKSTSKPETGPLVDNEAKQFDLYANWNTDFTFPHGDIGAPPGNATKWNLSKGPKPHQETGFYGLVSNDRDFVAQKFPNASAWAVGGAFAPAAGKAKEVTASGSLADALHSFIIGSHGRPWSLGAPAADHWSNFVEEIMERSLDWTTRVQRIQKIDIPRQSSALSFVNTFAKVNAQTDMLSAALSKTDFSDMSLFDTILNEADAFQQQGEDWVENGGDRGVHAGRMPPFDDEERFQRPPGGMSVLYIATFGDGPLEPPRQY